MSSGNCLEGTGKSHDDNAIFKKYRVIYHFNEIDTVIIVGVYNTAYQGYEKRMNSIDIP